MSDLRHVAGWLADLGRLTAGAQSLPDAKAKLAAYADLLAERFPPEAFTRDSLEAVASANKFFPSYGEIVGPLGAWWKERRPVLLAISGPATKAVERREPYVVTSTPDWCGKSARSFNPRINEPDDLDARRHNTQPPLRTVDEQLAILRAARATGRVAVDEGVDA